MNLLEYTPKKYLNSQFDTNSEVSTQADQNLDYSSFQNFSLISTHSQPHKLPKSKLKSSLCRNFTQKGVCPYGQRCQFAHGTHELRINQDANNSYKTKPCNAFFKKGHCHYGYRCNFVHSKPEQRKENMWKLMRENHPQVFKYLQELEGSRLMRILE